MDRPVKIVALDKDHTEFRGASTVWPKTIVARLTGGLGNQLFGYANGLSLARYFGASLEVTYGGSSRGFMLDRFGISLTPEREDEFLTAEGRTWLVSLTRNEIEEEYSRYIQQSKKTAPKHK